MVIDQAPWCSFHAKWSAVKLKGTRNEQSRILRWETLRDWSSNALAIPNYTLKIMKTLPSQSLESGTIRHGESPLSSASFRAHQTSYDSRWSQTRWTQLPVRACPSSQFHLSISSYSSWPQRQAWTISSSSPSLLIEDLTSLSSANSCKLHRQITPPWTT